MSVVDSPIMIIVKYQYGRDMSKMTEWVLWRESGGDVNGL